MREYRRGIVGISGAYPRLVSLDTPRPLLPSTEGEPTGMRVRIYTREYHTDPLRLAEEVNECIKSCENVGDTVLDADVVLRPNTRAEHGMEYLVIIKFDGNRH